MLRYVVALLLSMLVATTVAAFEDEKPDVDEAAPPEKVAGPEEKESVLDRQKRLLDLQVSRASQWADSFFIDPDYDAEVATSLFRIRPELHYREEQGLKPRLRVSLKLRLPNMGRKVSLVIGSDTEDDSFSHPEEGVDDNSIIGLQFFGKERDHWFTSLSAGIKFNDVALFVGPRVRYSNALGEASAYRITQTIRWQTNSFWQINTRLDLNHVINDRFFFRQSFDGRWRGERSDEEGYRTQVSSFLTQRLKTAAGMQYEFSTVLHTEPDTHVDRYTLSVRYRKKTSRDWLYYEIAPEISFEDEFDYKTNPGIRLRVEFFYGDDSGVQTHQREPEDTDDFRW